MIRFLIPIFFFSFPALPILHQLSETIRAASSRVLIDPKLVEAIIEIESNFDPNATSHKGAKGLMQVMPETARFCGIRSAHHPVDNIMGACDCLRQLMNRYRGNLKLTLAAYNAGPGAVDKYKGIPPFPETQRYVRMVLKRFHELQKTG